MKKLLIAFFPIIALGLALVLFALRPLIIAREMARTAPRHGLAPRPRPDELPRDPVLDAIFATAPPPRYHVLEWEIPPSRNGATQRAADSVVAVDGPRSLRHAWIEGRFRERTVRLRDAWEDGAAGLFHYFDREASPLTLETWWMTGTRDVQGRLFPLAAGNRLRFTVDVHNRSSTRDDPTEADTVTFTVVGRSDAFARGTPTIPGEVWVIRREETRMPEYSPLEIHYAPALGTAVLYRHSDGREERIIAWR